MRFSCTDFSCNKTVGQLNLLIVRTDACIVPDVTSVHVYAACDLL